MTDHRKSTLRSIMITAWSFRRSEPTRAFADCLRGAWRMIKRLDRATCKFLQRAQKVGGVVRLSPDLTRSPIRSSLSGTRYAGRKAYQAAYHTAWLGR